MSADDARQQQAMEANNSEAAPSLYDELARQPAAPPATDARPAAPAPQAKFTTLQKHIAFFDRDGDGVVGVTDTFRGFRALGFPIWFSVLAVLVINLNFAYWTQESWIPDPRFQVRIDRIHKTKHGSDTEVYDTEGRFVSDKFEQLWSKYDREGKGYLTGRDLVTMFRGNRNVCDPFGWFAFWFEWGTLYLLASQNGRLSKETIRSQYDGTLFYKIEDRVKEDRKKGVERGVRPLVRLLYALGSSGKE